MTTLYDILREHAANSPDKLALLSEEDGTRSYAQLVHEAAAFGVALVDELRLPVGERSCLWMWNRPEYVVAQTGAAAVGLPPVLANPEWSDAELEVVLRHSRARVVICEASLAARAQKLAARIDELLAVVSLGDALPEGALRFDDLIEHAPSDVERKLPPVPDDVPGSLMYTSGTTTGRPKAVAFDRNVARAAIDYVEMFGLSAEDRSIFVTPLFHGNAAGGLMSALQHGASAVFQRRFSARRFWSLVERTEPTYLFTLAPIVNILLGLPLDSRERAHSLRVIIALGAGTAAPLMEERFGAPVIDWYGMTEAGMGTYTRLTDERRAGSAGRPFEGSAMRILRDDDSEAAVGEVGEVCFREAELPFSGYLDDDEANAAALRGGHFRTGDLGYFDEDRFFYFVDRKKDIVRRGGENISSAEVENVIRQHPLVADVAIVGKPDPILGERVVAFVVPGAGSRGPEPAELAAFAEGRLAAYKLPEEVIALNELPRTATGKIQKFELRQRIQRRIQQELG